MKAWEPQEKKVTVLAEKASSVKAWRNQLQRVENITGLADSLALWVLHPEEGRERGGGLLDDYKYASRAPQVTDRPRGGPSNTEQSSEGTGGL